MKQCTYCGSFLDFTGSRYPVGDVTVKIKLPYELKITHEAKGLCQECQAAAANEVQAVIEKYHKEKSPE